LQRLYLDGNAYALALRNNRFEIDEMHLMDARQSRPQLATNGDVFYRLAGNEVIDRQLGGEQLIVPMSDVLHIRLHSNGRYPQPLLGKTPLVAAYGDLATYQNIKRQQDQFYQNRAAPSAVLSTDMNLDKDQAQALRDRWNEQSKGLHQDGVPILSSGLKVQPWVVPAIRAERL
jgi:phage portal protein BeeE